MRKIATTLVVMMIALSLTGCGNSLVKKSIEQAKTAIESKEYDKAIASLELALDEDKENKEANKLYEIVEGYQKAKKAIDENKFDEAKKILDDINEDYISYTIKDDIDVLKGQVDTYSKENDNIISVLAEGESLYNNKQYTECKILLFKNILGSNVDEIIEPNKYATEEQKAKAEDLINKSDQAIIEIQKQKEAEAQRKADEEKKNQESLVKRYYVPHLNKSLTENEMFDEYNKTAIPFDYIGENGISYMFNPGSVKPDGFNDN